MESKEVVRKRLELKQQEYAEILAKCSPETIESVLLVLEERRKRVRLGAKEEERLAEDVKSILELMGQYAQEIKEIFIACGEALSHITDIAPEQLVGAKIAKSENRVNHYETERGNWVFASSSPIDGKNSYTARNSQSGMIKVGEYILYGSDNLQIVRDEKGGSRVCLKKPNYAYFLSPKNFQPVVTLKRDQNGNPYFEFSEEWVSEEEIDIHSSEQVLGIGKITDVTALIKNYQVFCDVGQNGEGERIISAPSQVEAMQRLVASIRSGRVRYINGEANINVKEMEEELER